MSSIRELLREGTREHHARAEARLPLLDPALDRDGYARALAALLGFQRPLEAAMAGAPWDRVGLDWRAERPRAALLAADLARLGWSAAAVAAIPECDAVPRPASLAAALGCAYVLEGSTLGGQLIRRHVERTLGILPDDGCSFFAAHGDAVGPMWRAFLIALERGVEHEGCPPDEVLAAARETFDALAGWLGPAPVPVPA
ncbi:biliverdin-producing heme oxygenase [Roseisolibacter sp. H3M3-2]|uniref:biliverdin-producing heme oxygenase n=1 Tax=Roseisolibacter sp. H3M3-2 TaxID=3031323 RepID=UPI0023DACB5F|nr:biliverdin-producing heme oxygenase [Roseisolibacter sp. H3M3-2]MDF1502102.1 biliverdin-producing heme oxygenase [Roseisolibacter sp. H3M3-2]